jgi:thymidylate kinase
MKKFIINIEGPDGTGKTTIVQALFELICDVPNLDVYTTKAPYRDGVFFQELTGLSPSVWYAPRQLAMMFALNHIALSGRVRQFLEAAKHNAIILSDRGPMSSLVYNSTPKLTVEDIAAMHEDVLPADLTILLHAPVETLYERIHGRGEPIAEYEKNLQVICDKYNAVYTYYVLRRMPIITVDASGTIQDVLNNVLAALEKSPRWVRKAFGVQL